MPEKLVAVPGVGNVAFPDSMSDEEIGSVLQKQHPELLRQPTAPDPRSSAEVMQDQAAHVLKGIPQAVTGIPAMVGEGAASLFDMIRGKGSVRGQSLLKAAAEGAWQPFSPIIKTLAGNAPNPDSPEWEHAAEGAGAMLGAAELPNALSGVKAAADAAAPAVGGAWNAIKAKFPSKGAAGLKFQQVSAVAKDLPLNTAAADEALARAQELRARGSSMPKVLNDYAKNRKAATGDFMGTQVTDPMTYAEGRDFASNAGALSTRETTALNAKMQAQVKQFAKAMKDANRDAAVRAGVGDIYDQAMSEYARAMSVAEKAEIIKKWSRRTMAGALGLKASKELWDLF